MNTHQDLLQRLRSHPPSVLKDRDAADLIAQQAAKLTKALHELDALRLEHIKLTAERDGLRAQVAPDVDALAQHIRTMGSKTGAGRLAESIVDWLAASLAAPAQQAAPSLTVGAEPADLADVLRMPQTIPYPADWTRTVLRHALEAIEAGASAAIVMNVDGVKSNIRALLAAPSPPTTTQAQAGEKQG